MGKKRHKPEEIVAKLRQVEAPTTQGRTVAEAVNQPLRARAQDFGERIVDCIFRAEGDNFIFGHRVTLFLEVRVGCTPAPLRRSPRGVITHFPP